MDNNFSITVPISIKGATKKHFAAESKQNHRNCFCESRILLSKNMQFEITAEEENDDVETKGIHLITNPFATAKITLA